MLKKYLQFIKENFGGFDTLGEYIEYLAKDNEYAKHVISEYTKEIDPTVKISNAVNVLDKNTQEIILKLIQDEKSDIRQDNEVSVNSYTSTIFNESNQTGGKNIFKCFLKVLSALGQKSCDVNWNLTPSDWICMYTSDLINIDQIKDVMSRYLYFDTFIKSNQSNSKMAKLYYGVTNDLKIEYGININEEKITLGSFLLTQGTYNFMMTLDLKSSSNLKKFLVNFDLSKLNILSKVKYVMKDFFPGQSESKLPPTISGDVITFAYQGLGNWDNGNLDSGEVDNIKNNLRSFLMQYKWSDRVQINVIPSDHWVFINIKIK